MQAVTGAMGSLIPKLWGLVIAEYKLQKGMKEQVESLARDLETAYAVLEEVAQVPPDQLEKEVKLWAREIREASYDMEDVLDTFLVRVEGSNDPADKDSKLKHLGKKMAKLFKKSKARHDIAGEIDKIKKRLQEVKDRHATFTVNNIVSKRFASSSTTDPRLAAMYREVKELIGIDKSKADVISKLGGDGSNKETKIVSIVGVGGLGKTTLAKSVYDKLKPQFGCGAFVPLGQNPDLKKILKVILIDLGYTNFAKVTILDERQLINELRSFLGTKRYFIVIDDIWEAETWKNIKSAFIENNSGSRIILTTRKLEVTTGEVYKLPPLSDQNSRKLFCTRLFGEDKFPDNQSSEVHKASEQILRKCGGIPLAIITMASFLVGKSREQWLELCHSPGFIHDKDTMWILSLSFNDLPPHLRTCLLYLSGFPEDSFIAKDPLIWKWIAEGFVEEKQGMRLFEVGEGYFNDLVNRSMIQTAEIKWWHVMGIITNGCRVHDMVLDLLHHVSREENFFTISNSDEVVAARSSVSKVRRLAIQNRTDEYIFSNRDNIPQVRSFLAFMCDIEKVISFRGFKLLRVLALECHYTECTVVDLEHIGKLIHLRYLEIRGIPSDMVVLPEAIGDLKFLQTLNLMGNYELVEFPSSISRLTQLVCLRAVSELPIGVLGKLTCLEELEVAGDELKVVQQPWVRDKESYRQFGKDLCNLTQLRVLRIGLVHEYDIDELDLFQSIKTLQRIQHLSLRTRTGSYSRSSAWCAQLVLPRGLRYLDFFPTIKMDILPPCIDPSLLVNLSDLKLTVLNMDGQGLESLSRLPQLRHLRLETESTATLPNVAGNGRFQMLRSCSFPESMVRFVLNGDSSISFTIWNGRDDMDFVSSRKEDEERVAPVVMPNLQELKFSVNVRALVSGGGCCDLLGLEYLLSLQKIRVHFYEFDATTKYVVEEEEAALSRVVEAHPNHPMLQRRHAPNQ